MTLQSDLLTEGYSSMPIQQAYAPAPPTPSNPPAFSMQSQFLADIQAALSSVGSFGAVGPVGSFGQVGPFGSFGQVGPVGSLCQVGPVGSLGAPESSVGNAPSVTTTMRPPASTLTTLEPLLLTENGSLID